MAPNSPPHSAGSRAGRNAGNVLAAAVLLATGDGHIAPCPVRAAAGTADDDDIVAAAGDGIASVDVLDDHVGDRDSTRRVALEISTLVVLLDQDTVPGSMLAFFSSHLQGFRLSWDLSYLSIPDKVMSSYVIPLMVPVSPSVALMRRPMSITLVTATQ